MSQPAIAAKKFLKIDRQSTRGRGVVVDHDAALDENGNVGRGRQERVEMIFGVNVKGGSTDGGYLAGTPLHFTDGFLIFDDSLQFVQDLAHPPMCHRASAA